jgi:hypothetical protein
MRYLQTYEEFVDFQTTLFEFGDPAQTDLVLRLTLSFPEGEPARAYYCILKTSDSEDPEYIGGENDIDPKIAVRLVAQGAAEQGGVK